MTTARTNIVQSYYDASYQLGWGHDHTVYARFLSTLEDVMHGFGKNIDLKRSFHKTPTCFEQIADADKETLIDLLIKSERREAGSRLDTDFIVQKIISVKQQPIIRYHFIEKIFDSLCESYEDEINRAIERQLALDESARVREVRQYQPNYQSLELEMY